MATPVNFEGSGHQGLGGASSGVRQRLREVSTVENGPIGAFRRDTTDGSVYRYAYFAGACGPGKIAALDTSVAVQSSFDAAWVDSGGTAKDTYAAGDTLIYVKTSDITSDDVANVWAGGYLFITDAGGEGHKYKIRSHDAGAATAANVMGLEIFDGLDVALESEGSAAIVGHPYNNLTIANNGTDDRIQGIALVDVAAGEYAWVQTWGHGIVLADETAGTVANGTIATLSDSVNGAAQPLVALAEPQVGEFLMAGVDTEYVPIFIKISS